MKKIMAILAAASVLALGAFTGCKNAEDDDIITNGSNSYAGLIVSGSYSEVTAATNLAVNPNTTSTTTESYTFSNNAALYTWKTTRSGNYESDHELVLGNSIVKTSKTDTNAATTSYAKPSLDKIIKVGKNYYVEYTDNSTTKYVPVTVSKGSLTSGSFTISYSYAVTTTVSGSSTTVVTKTASNVVFAKNADVSKL